MNGLPANTQKAVDRYAPVMEQGLMLCPVTVEEWDEFDCFRPALEFLQQRLPVALLTTPLLTAFYKIEIMPDYAALRESLKEMMHGVTPLVCAIGALVLSLRSFPNKTIPERVSAVRILPEPEDNTALRSLLIPTENGYLPVTPLQFQLIRPLIAAQNGVELESDDANPELVDAERQIAELNNEGIEAKKIDLILGVAALTGADEADIYQWPILKLIRRAASLKRVIDYTVVSIGQCSGLVKFNDGSPCPSPWFDKRKTGSAAVVDPSKFAGGSAVAAFDNPSAAPPAAAAMLDTNNTQGGGA